MSYVHKIVLEKFIVLLENQFFAVNPFYSKDYAVFL